jgi:hypothetical protein
MHLGARTVGIGVADTAGRVTVSVRLDRKIGTGRKVLRAIG